MTLGECAELIGSPIRRMPLRAFPALARAMWRLRQSRRRPGRSSSRSGRGSLSNEKLKRALGWTPAHSRETFEITMRAQGKLPPAESPARGTSTRASALEPRETLT